MRFIGCEGGEFKIRSGEVEFTLDKILGLNLKAILATLPRFSENELGG